jgi:hypothetical protein
MPYLVMLIMLEMDFGVCVVGAFVPKTFRSWRIEAIIIGKNHAY